MRVQEVSRKFHEIQVGGFFVRKYLVRMLSSGLDRSLLKDCGGCVVDDDGNDCKFLEGGA